jgi:hypothetical protein
VIALLLPLLLAACAGLFKPAPAPVHPPSAANARLDAYAAARAAEIVQARRTADEMVAATASLPGPRQVRSSAVKTVNLRVTDRRSHETREIEVLDGVVAELPLALRGSPEHDAVMDPVKRLATWLAGQRGGAGIDRAFSAADARSERLKPQQDTPSDGQSITVRKRVDVDVPAGVERVTVRGADLPAEF